ncbi:MAG: hypothetical protein WDN29_09410 [Methylovirgula sp.]
MQSAGFNLTSTNLKPIVTSLDLNATYALRDEVAKGIEKFKAKAGAGRHSRRQYWRDHRHGLAAGFRPQQSR